MYCNAAATDSIRSSCFMTVMVFSRWIRRVGLFAKSPWPPLAAMGFFSLVWCSGLVLRHGHDAVRVRNRHRRQDEDHMDRRLGDDHIRFLGIRGGVDEGL